MPPISDTPYVSKGLLFSNNSPMRIFVDIHPDKPSSVPLITRTCLSGALKRRPSVLKYERVPFNRLFV